MSKRFWSMPSALPKRPMHRAYHVFLALALLSNAKPTFASTEVSGTISTNTRWDIDGSPYIVTGIIFVTATLTVAPGVEVLFDGYHGFYITSGALSAAGTSDSLIVFASTKAAPSRLDWPGLSFGASSNDALCIVKNAIVAFSGGGIQITDASPHIEKVHIAHGWDAGVQVDGGSPEIVDCVIFDILGSAAIGAGIYCVGAGTPDISGNALFLNNRGIFLTGSSADYPNPTITGNAIVVNTTNLRAAGTGNLSAITITAENNWWGTTNPTEIAATIVDHADDSNFPVVDFTPWLNSSPFTPDTTNPTVSISSPAASSTVSGQIPITGTASDANLDTYVVEYGAGSSPSSWTAIKTGYVSVTSAQLAVWDARGLSNGTYTVRVRADDWAGNDASDQHQVTLDNIQITGVSATPAFFAPGSTSTTISYTLDRACDVTIKIYELEFTAPTLFTLFPVDTALVATPVDAVAKSSGANTSTWNGRDDQSAMLPFRAYSFAIEATTGTRHGLYFPEYVNTPDIDFTDLAADASYDPYKNQPLHLAYEPAVPAWVNVKVVKAADPFTIVRGLVTWDPQPADSIELLWDGRTNTGVMVTEPVKVYTYGQMLPDNAVVTEPRSNAVTALTCEPYLFRPIYREITRINYTISGAAKVTVKVYDPDGTLFATLQTDSSPRSAGSYTLEWAGTNAAGKRAHKEGSYRVEIASTGVDNDTVTRWGSILIYK